MWLLGAFQFFLLFFSRVLCAASGNALYDPVLDPFLPASQRTAITDAATSRVLSERSLRMGKFVRSDA